METNQVMQTIPAWIPIGLTVLGLVYGISSGVFGFLFKMVFSRISEVKADAKGQALEIKTDVSRMVTEAKTDMKGLITDEERRRGEALGQVMAQNTLHYTDIKAELHNVRIEIKEIRDNQN